MPSDKPPVHAVMFGAWAVRRLPWFLRPATNLELGPQGLFLLWAAYAGLLAAAVIVLYQLGVWAILLKADPTGLTVAILLLFAACTAWAGARAWHLGCQREALAQAVAAAPGTADPADRRWARAYVTARRRSDIQAQVARDRLSELTHGPHEMAWWFNGIQLKLGLLGKVIGFSILALELGQMQSFDPSQSAVILKTLTGGLGVALLTTMAGLTCNILLGLQLMRLDRYADLLVADILALDEPTGRD